MENQEKIICSNIWKVFGPNEKSVLSNLGLYESVETPELMSGSLTKNNISYQLEPLIDNDLLIGITLFVVDKSSSTPN